MPSNPPGSTAGDPTADRTAPSMSVVVPVHGRWHLVHRLLAELTPEAGTEVLLVDDASPVDESAAVVDRFPGHGVRVVRRPVNGGFAAAVNTGVAASTAPVVLVVNSDLVITSATLRALADDALASGDLVAPVLVEHGRRVLPARRRPRPAYDLAEAALVTRLLPAALQDRARGKVTRAPGGADRMAADWVMGACMAIPRTLWDATGPLDETFFMNSEEVDWQLRARRAGARNWVRLDLVATHDSGETSDLEVFGRRLRWGWRARAMFVAKWEGPQGLRRLARLTVAADASNAVLEAVLRRVAGADDPRTRRVTVTRQVFARMREQGWPQRILPALDDPAAPAADVATTALGT